VAKIDLNKKLTTKSHVSRLSISVSDMFLLFLSCFPRPSKNIDGPSASRGRSQVMQMSQTQEQWMATSAQLRQLSQSQAALVSARGVRVVVGGWWVRRG
jgi:hypothetical protein